jgi:hypothetical protein
LCSLCAWLLSQNTERSCRFETLLTNRRQVAKQKQNINGPYKSASSMICSSTRPNGFSTVIDFAQICEKLMPSSRDN